MSNEKDKYRVAFTPVEDTERETSIRFGRWLNREGYQQYYDGNRDGDRWIDVERSSIVYTTAQLYDQFKKDGEAE